MRIFSRRTWLRGAALVSVGVLSGKMRFVAADPVEIQYWHQWGVGLEAKALARVVDGFMKLYPHIKVTLRNIPSADQDSMAVSIKRGYAPDLIHFVLSDAMPQFAYQGLITDLTGLLETDVPDWKDRLYPLGVEICQYGGRVFSLATANFNVGLLWNSALFSEVGLLAENGPLTTEELLANADKFYKSESASGAIQRLGFLPQYPGVDNGQFVQTIQYGWARGGEWYDEKAQRITANDPKNVEALQWELDIVSRYGSERVAKFIKSAGDYLGGTDLFQSAKLAMVYDGPWNLNYASDDFRAQIRSAAFPAPEANPGGFGTSFFDINANSIPVGAQHPTEAWLLLKYLAFDGETCSRFAGDVYNMCALRVHPPYDLERDERFGRFVNQQLIPSQRVWPRLPIAHTYQIAVAAAEQAVLSGQMKPKEALDKVTFDMQKALDTALNQTPKFVVPVRQLEPTGTPGA